MHHTIILLDLTRFCIVLATFQLNSAVAAAEESEAEKEAKPIPEARAFVTQHSGRFNGQLVRYTATAGETYLRDKDGEPKASIFTFSYSKSDVSADEVRPVTFVWNGGPGSASLWLHMGTYGPKRISVPSDASYPGSPPFKLVDAPETILDVTDLVFIDPVGTGFSRALGEHEGKEFWGLNEDAQSIAEFIRTWVTENGRWNSPRFLLGESFGTTRAAVVANLLQGEKFQMGLNGIIFISQALDYTGSTPYVRDNIIAHVTYLPTMAAVALYHGKINPRPHDMESFLQQARAFATDELLPALFKGNTLDQASRNQVRDRLAHFTGLSAQYIERANLRIQGFRFAKELLRNEGLAVGLLDARYTQDEIDDLNADPAGDAASIAISPAFKSALMDYMFQDLGVAWQRLYLAPADDELAKQWRWRTVPDGEEWEPMPVNTARELSTALRANPGLKVFVASGYYDLVTPFFDAEYTLNRHDIRANQVIYKYYTGGHMMYVNEPSRTQLLNDTRTFILDQISH
ncbi:MAG: serine carboxypeptidase [Proteobacteria bacterium]|nr:serine carboxypeptidase [Pseudomonadota bacterium]